MGNAKPIETLRDIPKDELITGGTFACSGCQPIYSLRLILKALGKNTIIINPAGCMTLTATYPFTPYMVPWIFNAIENAASTATGILMGLKAQGKDKGVNIVCHAGDGACYAPDTKIFTEDGFKWITEVTTNDKVWSVNRSTFELELQPVVKLHKYSYEGKMIRAKTRYVDFLVTPDHTVPTISPDTGMMKLRSAHELLTRYKTLLPRSFKWKGKNKKYFLLPKIKKATSQKEFDKFKIEDWLRLIGWYVTEGSTHHSKSGYLVRIYQSNKRNRKEILNLIKRMGIHCFECARSADFQSKQIYNYLTKNCGDHYFNKRIPKEFLELNPKLLRILYETLLKGDGSVIKPGKNRTAFRKVYITKSPYLKNNFAEICLKLSMCCNIAGDNRGIARISVQDKHIKNELYSTRKFTKDKPQVFEEDYMGLVYCPELPKNHTIIIERNGRISLSGNTYEIGFQSLSGMVHRKENIIYVCYNNSSFANTGFQCSAATPYGARTTTTPPGKKNPVGNLLPRKHMAKIIAAHGAPYVATACTSMPLDFIKKLQKAAAIEGPKFIDLLTPCIPGWLIDDDSGPEVGKMMAQTGIWPIYEIENGEFKLNIKPQMLPVEKALKMQGRFKHLRPEDVAAVQKMVNDEWALLNEGKYWLAVEY